MNKLKFWAIVFAIFQINQLQTLIAQAFPRDTSYTAFNAWKQLSKTNPGIKLVSLKKSENVAIEFDIVYASIKNTPYGNRDLHLDIFKPKIKGKYPALLMIHGGGWRSGNKTMERPMAEYVAEHGYVAIPVEYQLSPEAKYPEAVYNIKAAIRWIKANAESYSIDTTRIAIEGNSAGGQLAALVGMTAGVSKFEGIQGTNHATSTVHAIIDIDGVIDFMAPLSLNLIRKSDSPDAFWLGGSFSEKPEIWKEASPGFWVNKKTVPILFIASSQPQFHAGRDELFGMLDQYGIYSEKQLIPNSPHTFWLYDPWFNPTVNYVITFLDKVFKPTNK
jgi:acetyl esterase/lipase